MDSLLPDNLKYIPRLLVVPNPYDLLSSAEHKRRNFDILVETKLDSTHFHCIDLQEGE